MICLHGGISSRLRSLAQLDRVARPLKLDQQMPGLLTDILWSDPFDGIKGAHRCIGMKVKRSTGMDMQGMPQLDHGHGNLDCIMNHQANASHSNWHAVDTDVKSRSRACNVPAVSLHSLSF